MPNSFSFPPGGRPGHHAVAWSRLVPALGALLLLLSGCVAPHPLPNQTRRPFNFQTDTFAYANELECEYFFDAHGNWTSRPRVPRPDYTQHCFVVARSTRQFFEHARFDPSLPVADSPTYQGLIRRVLATGPSHFLPDARKIVIPGYPDLRAFSQAQESLLKAGCGSWLQSYFQHGHWRMLLPISRGHQERMSAQLVADLQENIPPVVHVFLFPHRTINHAMVLFAAGDTPDKILFTAYDPNKPDQPTTLTYDRATRTFALPPSDYFPGGRVEVYEVYRDWRY